MSRIRALYEVLSTACEAGASDVRFGPRGAVLLRIDGSDTRLEGTVFTTEDLREIARFIAGRARTGSVPEADGRERQALLYDTDALGTYEVATQPANKGHTLILEPLPAPPTTGGADAPGLAEDLELARR